MAYIWTLLKIKVNKPFRNSPRSFTSKRRNDNFAGTLDEYKRAYKILGIPENSDHEAIRSAYLKLVKVYHPDSGTCEANAEKFAEIDKAFKILLKKKSKERWDVNNETTDEQDIKHTAPQHRQYLSYDGIGFGTLSQRQKQYTKVRAMRATENVLKHRISKLSGEESTLMEKLPLKHKIKTKYGLERIVEDLIQESMSKGEFSNLSGSGKPLSDRVNRNPYVDFVTHKLNEILIDNGFKPEWITLQMEIRAEIEKLHANLLLARSHLGPAPLNFEESDKWNTIVFNHENMAKEINKKIDKFNLVVPIMNKQMTHVDLQRECDKILNSGKHGQNSIHLNKSNRNLDSNTSKEVVNIFSFFELLLKK